MDELELCKGMPLCKDKEDLKWCKNSTTWTVPDNWTPLADYRPHGDKGDSNFGQLTKCSFLQVRYPGQGGDLVTSHIAVAEWSKRPTCFRLVGRFVGSNLSRSSIIS